MKILIIRVSAIGDVFLATGFAEYVKKIYPDAQVDWLAEKSCASVLKNNPNIDNIIIWERNKKSGLKGLLKSSKNIKLNTPYDIVFDLQCLLKLFPIMTKIKSKNIIGISEYEFPMNIFYKKIIQTKRFEPLKDKYYRIADEILGYKDKPADPYISFSEEDRKKADIFFEENRLDRVIGCVFATSREHKYWQKEKWTAMADIFKEKYNAKCLLLGGPGDTDYADCLMKGSDNFISAVGKTTILQSMALISKCTAVVSTDTALMHFASILNIPTISLYGTNFFYSHHLGRENVRIVFKGDWNNKDIKVPNDVCKKNMNNIEPEDIFKAFEDLTVK